MIPLAVKSNNIDDGGQAFPCVNPNYDGNWNKQEFNKGMSLRDYFAAKAMEGYIANGGYRVNSDTYLPVTYAHWAEWSYQVADEMIKARKNDKTSSTD